MIVFIKSLKLLKVYAVLGWKNGTEYRKDFLINLLDFFVTTTITIIFWDAILRSNLSFPGWEFRDLIMLGIIGNSSWALSDYFAGAWHLPEMIIAGELDKYLCKPIQPLFGVIMENSQLDEVLKGSLGMLVYFIVSINLYSYEFMTFYTLVLGTFSMLIGILIISCLRVSIGLLAFWIGETDGLSMLLHLEDFKLERYPLKVFGKYSKIFIYLLPVSFISSFPTSIILGKVNIFSTLLLELFVLLIWFLIVKILWQLGVKKYEASGG